MKLIPSIGIILILCLWSPWALAQDAHKHMHDMHTSERIGKQIHESKVKGYTFSYYLMDMREMEGSHAMPMDKPHHIMVYITDKKGRVVQDARVGLWIKDTRGKDQKSMASYMSKGFGTMADMKSKGKYLISTKAVVNGKKLLDRFYHEMK